MGYNILVSYKLEVHLIAIHERSEYLIGSCKYRNEKICIDELDLLRHNAKLFGKGSTSNSTLKNRPEQVICNRMIGYRKVIITK